MSYAVVMGAAQKLFILSTCVTTLSTFELVIYDTVDGKENLEKKTREVTEIRMNHFGWIFLQLGCDMLW